MKIYQGMYENGSCYITTTLPFGDVVAGTCTFAHYMFMLIS